MSAGSKPSRTGEGTTAIVIMAAGKGTRLKSKHPKVLHEVCGKPLLAHVIGAARRVLSPDDIYAVVGHEAKRVRAAVQDTNINFIVQEPQLGTGHAIMCAREVLAEYDDVIVLSGDAPLITSESITKLLEFHRQKKAAMTILSAWLEDPTGYGRILRTPTNRESVEGVVEEKSCTPEQRKICEINSGFYVFSVKPLLANLEKLKTENPHREYYLTDMARVLSTAGEQVIATETSNPAEILGGNTRLELVELDRKLRKQKCMKLMSEGVTVFYPETCVIDADVEVGADTVIEPFVQLLGNTRVGSDCRIRSYSVIHNSTIGNEVTVRPGCVIDESCIEDGAIVGPYSHLRPGTQIGEGAHVGNFVETRKIRLGKKSKANHLTYLGDAEIGEGVNIGAGTITCNYDGVFKHRTVIEDGVFIGSNSTLVAPVRIGKGSYTGASSCITEDVPADALALGRARQIVKLGWAKKRKKPAK